MCSQREFDVPEVILVTTAVVTQFCKVRGCRWVQLGSKMCKFCDYSWRFKRIESFFSQEVLNIFNKLGSFGLVMWENEWH